MYPLETVAIKNAAGGQTIINASDLTPEHVLWREGDVEALVPEPEKEPEALPNALESLLQPSGDSAGFDLNSLSDEELKDLARRSGIQIGRSSRETLIYKLTLKREGNA